MPHGKMMRTHRSGLGRPGQPNRANTSIDQGVGRMSPKVAITVHRAPEEVRRLWADSAYRPSYIEGADAAVSFRDAPGDRGTEIHVDLERDLPGGRIGEIVQKLVTGSPLAKVKDDLRRFKQHVETGEVPRSDASPEGELAERKLDQRPAQPLSDAELVKVGI
jgi:uncharacterized membrane protein